MIDWVNIALEEGVRFFVTSLGNPRWVVEAAKPYGGIVYHDVTERKWALKALEGGVHGLIAVNRRAGGHAGPQEPRAAARRVGRPRRAAGLRRRHRHAAGFVRVLQMGYAGAQLGTRFIATPECRASQAYKQAIVDAKEEDIVLSERITGVPVAVINTPYIERMGTQGRSVRPVDAPGASHQEVDAELLRPQVDLAAQARLPR